MRKELRALFIHGVGQQSADFADEARRWLRAECADREVVPFFLSAHWAPLADRIQDRFLASIKEHGSKGAPMQRLAIGTLADALFYQSSPTLKIRIFDLLDKQMTPFGRHPVTVFAHSLGGLIFTDYLRCRPNSPPIRLVTLGCNIGLFELGRRFDCPKQVATAGTWINCFHERDVLGFPLRVDPGLQHVQDEVVELGGLLGHTGLSHILYWGDKKLWKDTLPNLLAL
jgi:hypothetical protein